MEGTGGKKLQEKLFDKKENGATCAIHFHESIHGMERNSKFEFLDENHIVQYLKAHT